jgi:3-oxoacid CoA-transferase
MKPKIYFDASKAVEDIFDGATITISGYGGVGLPLDLVDAIIEKKFKDLTVITVAFGIANTLIQHGCVKRVITTMPRMKFGRSNMSTVPLAKNLLRDQNIEVELVNQATIVERLRASASGIGAFYTPIGVGTELAEGKETKLINGVLHVLEYAIQPDFAICRVNTADLLGNVEYEQMFKNVNHEFISAGKVSIVQADQIVEPGLFKPDTTGCFVNRLLKTKKVHTVFRTPNLLNQDAGCDSIGKRIAADIPSNSLIELGIGIPWYVANYIDHNKDIIIHTEGIYGVKSVISDSEPDTFLRGPTSETLSLIPGGHTMTFSDSFKVIMRGLIDIVVLGAFQVDRHGTFANWKIPDSDRPPAVGASMEMAMHSKQVWIAMQHFDPQGLCKIVEACTYPITARNVVQRIYTELCTLEVTDLGLQVLDIVGDMSHSELEKVSNIKLIPKETI